MHPRTFATPLAFLQTFYPGSFPLTLPEPDRPPQRLPGALLSTEEAADYLRISGETLRRMVRRKAIDVVRVTPHDYRFRPGDLESFVGSRLLRRRSPAR